MPKTYLNQEIVGKVWEGIGRDGTPWYSEVVLCPVCKGKVGLRSSDPKRNVALGWYDPYRGKKGKMVHPKCLSDRRKAEIKAEGYKV